MDICVEVSMMSSHLELPRRGHLEQVLQMFGYLKKLHNADMDIDLGETYVVHKDSKREYWSSRIYRYIEE